MTTNTWTWTEEEYAQAEDRAQQDWEQFQCEADGDWPAVVRNRVRKWRELFGGMRRAVDELELGR